MKKQAFFYKNHYYLLPDDMADTDALIAAYGGRPAFPVTELIEKKCMTPYFVLEHTKEKTLKLPKNALVFPCEVELLTMKEYNDRLRAMVPETCKGCPYFGSVDETDASLEGHHEEIALDRVCFVRNKAKNGHKSRDFYPIDQWMKTFINRFNPWEYAQLIDEGRIDEATERFYGELSYTVFELIPPVFFTRTPEGKYALYCTAFLEQQDSLIMEYLFARLEKKYKKDGWVFKNYIPQGYMPEGAKAPLGLAVETLDGPVPYLSVTVYTEPEGQTPAYLWLCGTFGEVDYLSACLDHQILTVEDGQPLPEGLLSPDEFGAHLNAALACLNRSKSDLINPPPHILFGCSVKLDEEALDFDDQIDRNAVLYMPRADYLMNRFVLPILMGTTPENPWEDESIQAELGLPMARFVFPLPVDRLSLLNASEMKAYNASISELSRTLHDRGLFKCFGQITGNGQLELVGYVMNLTKFLYEVRRNAPIFAACPGELYIYTETHKNGGHYRLGFDMKRLHTEQKLWKSLI